MSEPIHIPINVTTGNLSGLQAIQQHLATMQRQLGTPLTGAGQQASYNIALNIVPGSTAGLQALQQQTQQLSRQVSTGIAQGLTPGVNPGILRALGFQQTPSGVQRPGYMGGLPPTVPTIPTPLGYTYVRPGGVRPMPTPPAAAPRPGSPTWMAAQGYAFVPAGTPPGQMPAPPAAPGLGGQPGGPISQAHLNAQAAGIIGFGPGVSTGGGGLTPAQLTAQGASLIGAGGLPPRPPPPPPPAPPAEGGGMVGALGALAGGGAAMLGKFGGVLRQVAALGVGFSAVQMIGQAMQAYEDRALGILDVGRQLDEQYGTIDTTLTALGKRYQVTAREGVAAMSLLGRVTGTVETATLATTDAAQVGRMFGMSPAAAAAMQANLIQYSPQGEPNLAALVGVFTQARQRGELGRMSFPRFGGEAAQVAEIGGFGTPLTGVAEAGDITRMMAGFGGRYEANPAAAFAEYTARQQAPKSVLGEALNYEAVAQVMRQHPEGVPWGNRTLHPESSWVDQQILMSEGARIPAYQAAQFAVARRHGGGSRDAATILYGQMTNAPRLAEARLEYETRQEQAGRPGGIAGAFTTQGATATGAAELAAREGRPWQPGQDIRERQMLPEELARTGAIKLLEQARTEMLTTIKDTAAAFNDTKSAGEALGQEFGTLREAAEKLKLVLMGMSLLPGPAGWGARAGWLAMESEEWLVGQFEPVRKWLGIPEPTTQPRKPQP
jgi:hypothetical protein